MHTQSIQLRIEKTKRQKLNIKVKRLKSHMATQRNIIQDIKDNSALLKISTEMNYTTYEGKLTHPRIISQMFYASSTFGRKHHTPYTRH